MKPQITHTDLQKTAEILLGEYIVEVVPAVEGIDHVVLIAKTITHQQLVIKTGPDADGDICALRLLADIGVKVPHIIIEGVHTESAISYPLIIMSYFEGKLLKGTPQKSLYIAEILNELEKIHSVESPGGAGYIVTVGKERSRTWKQFLLRNLNGESSDFNWEKAYNHPLVEKSFLKERLDKAKREVSQLPEDIPLRLIHTDLNGANIFIKDNHLEGIVDWSDAKFGDPLFDFSRLRMDLERHSETAAIQIYYEELKLRNIDLEREKVYYLINILDYINWYVLYGLDERLQIQLTLLEETMK